MATLRRMASSLTSATARTAVDPGPVSPPGRPGRGRRDLRLALGVGLVCLAVVLGARMLGSTGQRSDVWAARAPLAAGTTLQADDLVSTPVAADDLSAYVLAGTDVVGRRLGHDLAAGELLATDALTVRGDAQRRLVTVAVDPLHSPPGLARGERVDVYVTPKDGASVGGDGVDVLPSLVLARALVADPGQTDQTGTSTQVGVVLDVGAGDAARAVAAARGGDVDLVRVSGAS
jgi:Flp pilus assembly protein CpaB